MDDREKASDIFKKSYNPFVPKKVGFEEAFPTIKSILVEINERGKDTWGKRTYVAATVGEYIDCSNKRCYNGGFNLGRTIRDMVYKKETEKEYKESCQGYEGSPKGKKKYGSCYNTFEIKIKIVYKEDNASDKSSGDDTKAK